MDERWRAGVVRRAGRCGVAGTGSAPPSLSHTQSNSRCALAFLAALTGVSSVAYPARRVEVEGIPRRCGGPRVVFWRRLDHRFRGVDLRWLCRHRGVDMDQHFVVAIPPSSFPIRLVAHAWGQHRGVGWLRSGLQPVRLIRTCKIPRRSGNHPTVHRCNTASRLHRCLRRG